MLKKVFCVIGLVMMVFLSGCISYTTPVTSQQIVPQGEEATITFFRPSAFVGLDTIVTIWEDIRSDNDIKLVAFLQPNQRIRYVVAPGKHIIYHDGSPLTQDNPIEIDVAPKMNYYVYARPVISFIGILDAPYKIVVLTPDELSTEKFQKKIKECALVELNDNAANFVKSFSKLVRDNLQDVKKKKYINNKYVTIPSSYGILELY